MDLAMQRDLAHTQITDMLKVVADDMSSTDMMMAIRNVHSTKLKKSTCLLWTRINKW
ncbi:hypothetical protein RYX36_033645 [Vicia faba]